MVLTIYMLTPYRWPQGETGGLSIYSILLPGPYCHRPQDHHFHPLPQSLILHLSWLLSTDSSIAFTNAFPSLYAGITIQPPSSRHMSHLLFLITLWVLLGIWICFQWENRFKTANLQTFTIQFFQDLVADGVGSWLALLVYYSKFLKLCSTVYLGFQK